MADNVRIGIIGDHDPRNPTHAATGQTLAHAARALDASVDAEWLPTDALEGRAPEKTRGFDALFCSPGSPYGSLEGALEAIRVAREDQIPFVGTCGGFQHAVVEYARNVLGLSEAGHTEYDPDAPVPFVSALGCSPFGQRMCVKLEAGSRAQDIYGKPEAEEEYRCNYGLEPGSRSLLEEGGLRVSGTDPDGEARILELPGHPFYLVTLFVPQLRSTPYAPHPLIVAFVQAGLAAKTGKRDQRQTA